jgi:hypothetical protein
MDLPLELYFDQRITHRSEDADLDCVLWLIFLLQNNCFFKKKKTNMSYQLIETVMDYLTDFPNYFEITEVLVNEITDLGER